MKKRTLTREAIRAQIPQARARGEETGEPRAREARYEAESGRVLVELDNGCVFGFPVEVAQGLRGSKPEDLEQVEVVMDGAALRWETIDADLLVAGLLRGIFGTPAWMREVARELGRRGGRSRSPAKAAAARANGRKGGRPKKRP